MREFEEAGKVTQERGQVSLKNGSSLGFIGYQGKTRRQHW
jgi:hypothetical protein